MFFFSQELMCFVERKAYPRKSIIFENCNKRYYRYLPVKDILKCYSYLKLFDLFGDIVFDNG